MKRFSWNPWWIYIIAVAILVSAALVPLIISSFVIPKDIWDHLRQYVLKEVIFNSVLLVCGVSIGTLFLGISSAWICTRYDFPGVRIFSRLMMLPLAIPGYIYAFVYIGLLDYTGPIQTFLREQWQWDLSPYIPIRSGLGVIVVMSFSLYPYVYLLSKNALETFGYRFMEVSQSLGLSQWQSFRRVIFPMCWPWIIAGLSLVIMECLADFGTVATFNYTTFTTAIYKVWFGFFSWSAAAQLSCILLFVVFLFLFIEKKLRALKRYDQIPTATLSQKRISMKGSSGWLMTGYMLALFGVVFIIPVSELVFWVFDDPAALMQKRIGNDLKNSLLLAFAAGAVLVFAATMLSFAKRQVKSLWAERLVQFANLGYAVPGTVLAVGVMSVLGFFGFQMKGLLIGALFTMVLAYTIRFLTVSFQSVDASMSRINRHLDLAASSLGQSSKMILSKIHLPLLRRGMVVAFVLGFIEVLKEMPITLMTRPFGWDTLAVRIFEYTSEGQWELAALPALLLVGLGLIPSFILSGQSLKGSQ